MKMIVKLKCDDKGNFGFTEKFKYYAFNNATLSIMAIANAGSYFSEPYILRGGNFEPAKVIEEEMGIEKYIKAKKPFYSVLGTGNIILDIKVAYDFRTGEYLKEKSTFKKYGVVKDSLKYDEKEGWSVQLKLLTSGNNMLSAWLDKIAEEISKMGNDREKFLKSRFK